jgi:hypothetical protein
MASPPTRSTSSGPPSGPFTSSSKVTALVRLPSSRATVSPPSVTSTLARQSSRMKWRFFAGRRVLRGTATAPSLSAAKKVTAKPMPSGMKRATRCSASTPSSRRARAARVVSAASSS